MHFMPKIEQISKIDYYSMVISQNKYQIQIPHAIWTLERTWYYAITTFISQLTFIHNPPYTCTYRQIERQIIIETTMLLHIRILLDILY